MAKKLTITIHVNPAAAVRAGKSQCGACELVLSDDDLAQLTPEQRETLAKHVDREQFPPPFTHSRGVRWDHPLGDDDTADASIETLALLLDRRKEVVEARLAELQAEREEKQRNADEKALAAIAEATTKTKGLDGSGDWDVYSTGRHSIVVPVLSHVDLAYCSVEVREQYKEEEARRKAEAERLREAEVPRILAEKAERQAAQAAAEAATAAAYEEQYVRLPEPLRARHAEGYATDDEVLGALRAIWREDAGYSPENEINGWYDKSSTPVSLTDEQYQQLLEVRASAPEGAEVEAVRLFLEPAYREATPEDDLSEIDEDGEVRVPDAERVSCIVARVCWVRAGVKVVTRIRLD